MDNGAAGYRRFLDGDESAFDELMKDYFRGLVFFIDRYVRDIHTAEDLAIDAFSDLLVHKRRYNFKTSFKTYLFMMGRCRALDYLKRQKIIEFSPLYDGQAPDEDDEPIDSLIKDERKRAVNEAVSLLPRDMREAVHLVFFEEMTYDEAARVLKKNRKQVDNLLYRAKKELRRILKEEGERPL